MIDAQEVSIMMELRHLRAFLAVADELHFGRAAQRLQISQPPLSRQIQQLERHLGVRLFLRRGRGVELTDAGRLLQEEARRTVEQAERVNRLAGLAAQGRVGHLRVGVVGSALYGGVPAHLAAFRRRAPDVVLSVEAAVTSELLDAVAEDRLDVAFARAPFDVAGLAHRRVDAEPLVAAVPVEHPLAGEDALVLDALAEEPFVLFPRALGVGYFDLVLDACRASGFTPEIAHQAVEIHTIIGLVAAGLGVSLPPASVTHLHLPGVRYVPLADPPLLELHLVWSRARTDALLDRFLDSIG